MAKKTQGKKIGGRRISAAEREERIRIVESLIVAGRGSSPAEVALALAERNRPDIGESTIRTYMREARARLTAEHESLRSARREILIRSLLSDAAVIQRKLNENGVVPRWQDRVATLKLLAEIIGVGEPGIGAPKLPDDDVDLNEKNEDELDAMIASLLEQAGDAVPAAFKTDDLPS